MKRMSRAGIVAVLLTACSPGPTLDTRTYALKYLRGPDVAPLVTPYVYNDRPNAKGVLGVADNAITVRETPDNLDKIARVLVEYDRPRPFVRLTFHLIEADGASATDPTIRDVEATLRQLFRFQGYRLVSEEEVNATEKGEVTLRGSKPDLYLLESTVQRVGGSPDSATVTLTVHLSLLPLEGNEGSFRTTVTIPVGKTAVLGNVQPLPKSRTLILTVRPEVLATSP